MQLQRNSLSGPWLCGDGYLISLLVDVFLEKTGAELVESDIASCWNELPDKVLHQKEEGPFSEVISHLDELSQHLPTMKAWDELVFPTLQLKPTCPSGAGI